MAEILYSDEEFGIMKTDVLLCKELGCDGVVFGMLNTDGSVDTERCRQLVELAHPMGVTFHRAFDRTDDPSKALEDIISIGCERILTSGLRPHVMLGVARIASLVMQAAGRIIIMPGGGLTTTNIRAIARKTGVTELHTSGRHYIHSKMDYINEAMEEKLGWVTVDPESIRYMISELRSV